MARYNTIRATEVLSAHSATLIRAEVTAVTDEIISSPPTNSIPNTRKWLKLMPPEEQELVLVARKKMQLETAKRNTKKYYYKYSTKEAERNKKWHKENADYVREKNREYRKKFPEKILAMNTKWRAIPKNRIRSIISSRIHDAKRRGILVDEIAMKEYIENPPTHCEITGCELDYSPGRGRSVGNSPSFDRINPSLGYVRGNIAVTTHGINTIKTFGTAEEHRMIAEFLERRK